MARPTLEWIGKDDSARAPGKVRQRIIDRRKTCGICGRGFVGGEKIELDHEKALINGGENREANLRPLHAKCHQAKTAADLDEKVKTAAMRQKHLGIQTRPSQPFPKRAKTVSEKRAKALSRERMPPLGPKRIYEERT